MTETHDTAKGLIYRHYPECKNPMLRHQIGTRQIIERQGGGTVNQRAFYVCTPTFHLLAWGPTEAAAKQMLNKVK